MRRRRPTAKRLAENSVLDPETGCLLWTGAMDARGYGRISVDGKPKLAHRVSYAEEYGPIPDGVLICHHCDVPSCIRPSHLFAGSQTDNMRDAAAKGRNSGQKKTHCPAGHPYADSNLRTSTRADGGPNRVCRECHRQHDRKWTKTPRGREYERGRNKDPKRVEYGRRYREKNRTKIRAQQAQYRDEKRNRKSAAKETAWVPTISTSTEARNLNPPPPPTVEIQSLFPS